MPKPFKISTKDGVFTKEYARFLEGLVSKKKVKRKTIKKGKRK